MPSNAVILRTAAISAMIIRGVAVCGSFKATSEYYQVNQTMQQFYIGEAPLSMNQTDVFCNATTANNIDSTSSSCGKGMCFFEAPTLAIDYGAYAHEADGNPLDVFNTTFLALASNANETGTKLYQTAGANNTFTICLSQGTSGYFLLTQSWLCINGTLNGCGSAFNDAVTICGVNTHMVNGTPTAVISNDFVYTNGTTAALQSPMPSETAAVNSAFTIGKGNSHGMIALPATISLLTVLFMFIF